MVELKQEPVIQEPVKQEPFKPMARRLHSLSGKETDYYQLSGVLLENEKRLEPRKDERFATKAESEVFWGDMSREAAIRQAYIVVSRKIASEFDTGMPAEYSRDLFQLLVAKDRKKARRAGACDTFSGKMGLVWPFVDSAEAAAEVAGHEAAHFVSERLHRIVMDESQEISELQRSGIRRRLKKRRGGFLGSISKSSEPVDYYAFSIFNEPVTERTAMKYLHQGAPKLKSSDAITCYKIADSVLTRICKAVSEVLSEEYSSPDEVYKLFQQATFKQGGSLSLFKVLSRVYGPGGLRELAQLTGEFDYVGDHDLSETENQGRLRGLLLAIDKPLRRVESKALDGEQFDIDYSKVDHQLPLESWFDGRRSFSGVKSLVELFFKNLQTQIEAGGPDGKYPLVVYDPEAAYDGPRLVVKRKKARSKDGKLEIRAGRAACDLLFDVLRVEHKPAFVQDSKKGKIMFHKASAVNHQEDGKDVYLMKVGDKKWKNAIWFGAVLSEEEIRQMGGAVVR